MSCFFLEFFLETLIALLPVTGVFFGFFISQNLRFLSRRSSLFFLFSSKGFATLAQTAFVSLDLDSNSLGQAVFAIVP